MTHDELVQKANFIFDAIKKRDEIYFSGRKPTELTPNEEAEVMDHDKDIGGVLYLESQGVGDTDCFVIANVLLRAIDRQWRPSVAANQKP